MGSMANRRALFFSWPLALGLAASMALMGLPAQTAGSEPSAAGEPAAAGRAAFFIDRHLLPAPDEFFLDMFMDRYPADGGYRVKRFHGFEFFDAARERAVEKKRQALEAAWTEPFRAAGRPATSLSAIEMPLRGVPVRAGGFRSRPAQGFPAHKAYDIMVAEGTPVHPIGHGVVVMAESEWWRKVNRGEPIRIRHRDWWDTALIEERPISLKSGNFVVIFHPPAPGARQPGYYSFYAHMADGVPVQPGQVVGPGDVIGFVEHSGYNAMREGHGGHLHISALKDLGQGYLEPIPFGKHLGLKEARGKARKPKARSPRRR